MDLSKNAAFIIFGLLSLAICYNNGENLKSSEVSECFPRLPRYELIRLNRKTVNATSENDCLKKCLASPLVHNFVCFSVLFYPNVPMENCILNSENRLSRPDAFRSADKDNGNVVYFDNVCAPGKVTNSTDNVAVANMTTGAESKNAGYFSIIQPQNLSSGLGSLFMMTKSLPSPGNYSIRLSEATACSQQLSSMSSPINNAKYTEIGQVSTDPNGNLIAGRTSLGKTIYGPDSVLGKTVLLIQSGSPTPAACGVLLAVSPWSSGSGVISASFFNMALLILALYYYLSD